jgi:hypothetical protein
MVMEAARAFRVQDRDKFLRLVADQLRPRGVDASNAVQRAIMFLRPNGEHAA